MSGAKRSRSKSPEVPQRDSRSGYSTFFFGAFLLGLSWALARWAPIRRAPDVELEEVSVGLNLLVAAAVPWLLQWAGVVLLFLGARRFVPSINRRLVFMGAVVPLLVGLVWWTSLVVIHWSDNPLEVIEGMMQLSILQQFGEESVGQGFLHDVVGPLATPFLLHGPYSMSGWISLWIGLSTAAVMGIWIAIAKIMTDLEKNGSLRPQQWLLCAALIMLWLLPVVIRTVSRVWNAF